MEFKVVKVELKIIQPEIKHKDTPAQDQVPKAGVTPGQVPAHLQLLRNQELLTEIL